jgi:hypothetical protein
MEIGKCAGCGKPFERRAGRKQPRAYCDAVKCQKIKNIKNTVARFDTLPRYTCSEYRADIDYHGCYMP